MRAPTDAITPIVQQHLEKAFLVTFNDKEVSPGTNLFQAGLMDSFAFVEMIAFLEGRFGIQFTEDEMLSKGLSSLTGIVEAVDRKVNGAL
jgi:D-alanine--poly(phosphoribitol) ligase subunit 2